MTETAIAISSQVSKLSKPQLKWAAREADRVRQMELLDKFVVPIMPVVAMVGGFLAVDYFEQKVRTPAEPNGKGGFFKHDFFTGEPNVVGPDTYIGPAAANVLRLGIVAAFAKVTFPEISLI